MPRRGDASQEINRTAPRSDRPAIALFKSRSWSCSAIHFDVSGQSGLFATLDVCQKRSESTRLNSSHPSISYAVFCLKKKNKIRKHEKIAVFKNKTEHKTLRDHMQ